MYVHAWSHLLQYVCTCMVSTATVCTYTHGTYLGLPDPLLTTHAHYIREGFVEAR